MPRSGVRLGCLVGLAWACVGTAAASEVFSAIPGAAKPPITLHDVVDTIEASTRGPVPPAEHGRGPGCGAAHGSRGKCRHEGCTVPGCPASCPVRPASFGYYDTRWRIWPGQGPEQASRTEPAAPVMAPKSEVPTADEESPVPDYEPAEEPAAEDPAATQRQVEAQPSILPPPEADRQSAPQPPAEPFNTVPPEPKPERQPQTRLEPEPEPLALNPAEPAAEPVNEKSAEDNLFDEANLRRRGQERLAVLGQAAMRQERLRREALRQQATRLVRPSPAEAAVRQASHLESAVR